MAANILFEDFKNTSTINARIEEGNATIGVVSADDDTYSAVRLDKQTLEAFIKHLRDLVQEMGE